MAFIGIVAEKKEVCDIEKNLKNYFENLYKKHTIFFIQNSNIENIKNIKFDTILLCSNIICNEKMDLLKHVLKFTNYAIVNCDTVNLNLLKEAKAMLISYGFQTKATITMSSIDDENMILCIQRGFWNANNISIEPQEICIHLNELLGNKYSKMGSFIVNLLYLSQKNKKIPIF